MRLLIVLAALVAHTVAGTYEDKYYRYRGPPAPLTSDGMVMDTPEVARARAAHLAMHAATRAKLRKAQNQYDMYNNGDMTMMLPETMTEMTEAPPATPKRQRERPMMAPLAPDGRVMDTPEVAAAKRAHMAAHARAASKASEFYELDVFDGRKNLVYLAPLRVTYNHATPILYRGPFAPLGTDGRVIDTPEVARAREAHMKAHARAAAMSTKNELYY